MGCCFSSSKKRRSSSPPCSAINGRDPPPLSPLEEETVKEVLSETPIPKPHHSPKVLVDDKVADFPQVKIESTAVIKSSDEMKFESTDVVNKGGSIKLIIDEIRFESAVVNKGGSIKLVDETKFESTAAIKPEVSEEPSEMCSFTESYSTTATATATEKREEDGEVTQRSPIRVHRKSNGVRESSFRSQTVRSAPSPEKRRSPASSRGVQGRGMPQQRRNVIPPNGTRRGPGENGARRSQSPAALVPVDGRRNVRNRSPSPAREGKSQARNVENEGTSSSRAEKPKEEVSPETGESLDNHLVSMECFLFL